MRAAVVVSVLALSMVGCDRGDSGDPASRTDGGRGESAATMRRPAPLDEATLKRAVKGAPPPLAALHGQANELLEGGADGFRARLAKLRGYPVVVNKWASWCPPCRAEFPFFQRQAAERARDVAFVGVNSNDNDDDAREFLDKFPVPYPSYKDPDLEVAAVFKGVAAFPVTAFYDSRGKLAYVKQGGYKSERDLAEDIERHTG